MRCLSRCSSLALIPFLFCVSAYSQDDTAVSPAPLEFILHPVQAGFENSLHDLDPSTEVVFTKEPDYAGARVYRHALRFGKGPSDFIGMAYDVAAETLYIDANRNLDLTDDGPGVKGGGSLYGSGVFSDVHIEVFHDGIAVPYVLDITIFGNYYLSATVKSGWRREIELDGKQCIMGVSDNLNGIFDSEDSFVFDHERHREARLPSATPGETPLPQWLYFEGQSYRIESAFRALDDETVVAVTLTPIMEDLMDIAFEGQLVSRVLLKGRDQEYGLLDWPVSAMRIPSGAYTPYQVRILDSFSGYPKSAVRLASGGNTLLKTGGPLNPHVSVSRSGAYLSLDYSLRGVDGTQYSADRSFDNPRFAVYRGDRRIAEGRFEYG